MKRNIFIFYILISFNIFSQNYETAFQTFLSKSEFKNANIGLYIENITTKTVVYQNNENQCVIPASVFKIFPTSYALELFGNEHKFKTNIAYSGTILADGTLNGNIYIIGGGDPCLGSSGFKSYYEKDGKNIIQQWAAEIYRKGIKKVNGDIISDISYFGKVNIPDRWIWQDIENYYGNQGSALNYMDNMYYVHFATGTTLGAKTKVTYITPSDLGLTLQNEVISSTYSGDDAYIFKGCDPYNKVIRGTLPTGKTDFVIKGSMPEPELYVANLLSKELEKLNININGKKIVQTETDNVVKNNITTTYSPDLQAIITNVNQKSNNTYAQILGLHIEKATGKDYLKAVTDFLVSKKISTDGFYFDDASGLSHFNTLTAKNMVQYLKYLYGCSQKENFIKSLPVAGVSGTLSSLNVGNNIKVTAKSGSMFRVASYAGFITNSQGEDFVFCFVVNNFTGNYYNIKLHFAELFRNI